MAPSPCPCGTSPVRCGQASPLSSRGTPARTGLPTALLAGPQQVSAALSIRPRLPRVRGQWDRDGPPRSSGWESTWVSVLWMSPPGGATCSPATRRRFRAGRADRVLSPQVAGDDRSTARSRTPRTGRMNCSSTSSTTTPRPATCSSASSRSPGIGARCGPERSATRGRRDIAVRGHGDPKDKSGPMDESAEFRLLGDMRLAESTSTPLVSPAAYADD